MNYNLLKIARDKKGFTINQAAEKAKISRATIWRMENGKHVAVPMLEKYCKWLGTVELMLVYKGEK